MRMSHYIAFAVAAFMGASCQAVAGTADTLARQLGRTTEREVNVVLSFSFGSVTVGRGEGEKIVAVRGVAEQSGPRLAMDYAIRNRVGYMDIRLGEEEGENAERGSGGIAHLNRGSWNLDFSDAVPISFEVELGVGKGTFDLSGLQVKDFNLSTGASDVTVTFNTPNQESIENINIETGLSRFVGEKLGNANFRHLNFQGGVGTYTLDFSGQLQHEVDVEIDVGMGSITIIVPSNIGARVFYKQNWLSSIDLEDEFTNEGEGEYRSANYATAEGKMNIRIGSGLGSIKLRRQ